LQNGEIQRLGSDRPRRVNVRVIAATNRNLHDSVRDGDFRADLYHRLSVYPVPIPPLRERGNDVLLLAGRFLELNRARLGLRSLRLSPDAEVALCRYFWPGNVRELEHVISRAVLKAVSRGATRTEIISLGAALLDLDEDVARQGAGSPVTDALVPSTVIDIAELQTIMPLKEVVERSQRHAIQQALDANQGNWASAARMLNVDASNLHKLAYRLGLK
jgi:anaerobic nitric oxide reductase transcription regulator